jgi:monofunctional glycosyltransferase
MMLAGFAGPVLREQPARIDFLLRRRQTRACGHVVSLDSVKEHVLARQSYAINLAPATSHAAKRKTRKPAIFKRFIYCVLAAAVVFYSFVGVLLVLLRRIDPPSTAVQIERRLAALVQRLPYKKRYSFVPLERISPQLQHAVVAAEDARFFQHHGFDWKEIGNAIGEDLEGNRSRGASTITQQLVRNLFLSTNRSVVRKALEFSIVPLTEGILPKKRILELYLNIVEWGPGIYGAEAASRYYFGALANRITREQAVELAEILPAPLHRKPTRITPYGARILERMRQMGF